VLHLDGTLAPGSISLDQPLFSSAELAEALRAPWHLDHIQVPGLLGPTRLAAGPTDDGTGVAVVAVSLAEGDAALADLRQELAAAFRCPARLELTERPRGLSAAKPACDQVELIVEVFRVLADGSRAYASVRRGHAGQLTPRSHMGARLSRGQGEAAPPVVAVGTASGR
jgi:hypothetical protein